MKKSLVIIFIFNIFLVNNLFAATELNPRDTLTREIISSRNAWENHYTEGTPEYNDAKARYDKAMSERDALDAKAEADKKEAEEKTDEEDKTEEDPKAEEDLKADPLGECGIDVDNEIDGLSIKEALDGCLEGSALVDGTEVTIDGNGGFGIKLKNWVSNIALFLGVFAVGSIVIGGLMLTMSSGEEEKIKKAKDIVKWGIIGFLGVISASAIINLIVKIMYSL